MLRRSLRGIALIVAAAITAYCYLFIPARLDASPEPSSLDWSYSIPQEDTAFGGLFFDPEINDSLPYYEYKRIKDSTERIKNAIALNNRSTSGNGRGFGAFGVYEVRRDWNAWFKREVDESDSLKNQIKDSINYFSEQTEVVKDKDSLAKIEKLLGELSWRWEARLKQLYKERQQKEEKLYYLGLEGYSTNEYSTRFFMDGDSYHLAYVKWDSIRKRTFDSTMDGHYERKPIAVRYAAEDKRVLIPITKQGYENIYTAMNVMFYMICFLFFYFFIGQPMQIVIDIARGNGFHARNGYRFKLMSFVLLIHTLIGLTAPYILHYFYKDVIPREFQLAPFSHKLYGESYLLLVAVGLFVVGIAFQRGNKLQKENALTI